MVPAHTLQDRLREEWEEEEMHMDNLIVMAAASCILTFKSPPRRYWEADGRLQECVISVMENPPLLFSMTMHTLQNLESPTDRALLENPHAP